jgi:two-component system, NarL family, nitrate/nitrite response regulator NarL
VFLPLARAGAILSHLIDPRTTPIRVLVADSKQLWSGLLLERLLQLPRFQASTSTLFDDFAAQVASFQPDVVVIGIEVSESGRALDMLRSAHDAWPSLKSVVLLSSATDEIIRESFFAGATGVVSSNESFDALVNCVSTVDAGQVWLRSDQLSVFTELIDQSDANRETLNVCDSELLTSKQRNLVTCVAKGMTNREIALQLDLSEHTVRNYLFRIYRKFGVSNRAELVGSTMLHTLASQDSDTEHLSSVQ